MAKVMMVIGAMVVFGTAGSSDLGLITAQRETLQLVTGLLLMVIGFCKERVWEWKE